MAEIPETEQPQPANVAQRKRLRLILTIYAGVVVVIGLTWLVIAWGRQGPQLTAGNPERTPDSRQLPLETNTSGGVDVYSYRVRLTKSPLPPSLRQAGIPETGPFRLNFQDLKINEWIDFSLDEPIHVDRKTGGYLPLDMRHTLFEGPAEIDLEITYGQADNRKTLSLSKLRIFARRDF